METTPPHLPIQHQKSKIKIPSCLFALFLSSWFAIACQPIQGPPPKLAGSGMDMFAPVKMRLHPLSRILLPAPSDNSNPATSPAILEARLELSDQFNDPGKGVGDVKLQLFDQPAGGLIHKGDLLGSWNLSINTPESNRDHWDKISRTYFFKLPIPVDLPKRPHLLLVATLTLPNGQSLTDDIELPLTP